MRKPSAALSPVALLNAVAGSRRVTETTGLAFGPGARDRLDVYSPAGATGATHPLLMFFYGGGWEAGDRRMFRFVGTALAARGIVTVIPDHGIYPATLFPGFVEDAARAMRWTVDNADRFGGDPRRLVVGGHSSGAHIAAMLALDRRWLAAEGLDPPSDIRGLVGLAGPYDFLPLRSPLLATIFGPEAGRAASQPINFVTPDACPSLLISGSDDTVVDPQNSARLAARLRQAGARAELKFYPRVGHELLVGAFARPLQWMNPVLADTVAFVSRVTSGAGVAAEIGAAG